MMAILVSDSTSATPDLTEASTLLPQMRLWFDIGQVDVDYSLASQVQPGYTFRLATDPAEPVTIRCGGKQFGTGRIVLVDGCLAVQLTTVSADPPHA
jgi:flagellar motor switch/type III secretory pathway protein FliN